VTKYFNDAGEYWDAYADSQNQFYSKLNKPAALPSREPEYQYPHWECVRCHQKFETLEELQAHYTHNQLGADPILIPQSKRGYTEESWRRGQKVINAPTIKSVM
jgi:hypothetical protein